MCRFILPELDTGTEQSAVGHGDREEYVHKEDNVRQLYELSDICRLPILSHPDRIDSGYHQHYPDPQTTPLGRLARKEWAKLPLLGRPTEHPVVRLSDQETYSPPDIDMTASFDVYAPLGETDKDMHRCGPMGWVHRKRLRAATQLGQPPSKKHVAGENRAGGYDQIEECAEWWKRINPWKQDKNTGYLPGNAKGCTREHQWRGETKEVGISTQSL